MGERRERTRQRVLDGAAAAFAKAGYAATSMDDIAAAAGVSRLLLYRDFAGKQELYHAVLQRTMDRIGDSVLAAATGVGGSVRMLFSSARADPDGFLLLLWYAPREPSFAGLVSAFTASTEQTAEEILTEIEPDPVLRRWVARVGVRQIFEMITLWLQVGDHDHDEEALKRIIAAARATSAFPAGRGAPIQGQTR